MTARRHDHAMIVAIDITTAPSGDVTADTLGLISTLYKPGSPARRLVLLGREEHRRALRHATHGLATVLTLDPPEPGRRQMAEYRQRKLGVLHDHDVDLLHVAGGGPLDLLAVGGPVVLEVKGLGGGGSLLPAERWHCEAWWRTAAYRADALIVPAAPVREDLCRQLGVEADKVFVSPEPEPALPPLTAAYAYAVRAHPNRKAA